MANRKTKTSKFLREYGSTIQQLADKYDLSIYYLYTLHLKGELHKFIKEQEPQQKVGSAIKKGIENARKLTNEILERHGK